MSVLRHIAFIIPLVIACGSKTNVPVEQSARAQAKDSSLTPSTSAQASMTSSTLEGTGRGDQEESRLFRQSLPLRVRRFARNNEANSSSQDTTKCIDWSLTEEACAKALRGFAPITGHDWGELFDVWPCQVEGELEQEGQGFKFAINAGSWCSVQCGDTTLYFGDMDKRYRSQFVSSVWSGE